MNREPFHPGLDDPRDTLADGTDAHGDDFDVVTAEIARSHRTSLVVALVAFALIVAFGLALA